MHRSTLLDPYHSAAGDLCNVSAEQGSEFAKAVAGDFNPLHDASNSRFCVPGDLLFALILTRQGLSQSMRLHFDGMALADMALHIPAHAIPDFALTAGDKTLVRVERAGALSRDQHIIEQLIRCYVSFSGRNFPHILVPLMEQQGMMINPDRPLVIYEGMAFELASLSELASAEAELALELIDSRLKIDGKRARAELRFAWRQGDAYVGSGTKTLLLSGLRPLEPVALQGLVKRYEGWRQRWLEAKLPAS
jgi:hypothetical protein